MHASEQSQFDQQYQQHLTALKRQGKAEVTIDSYARAVRRIAGHFGRSPRYLIGGGVQNLLLGPGRQPLLEHAQDRSARPAFLLHPCAEAQMAFGA